MDMDPAIIRQLTAKSVQLLALTVLTFACAENRQRSQTNTSATDSVATSIVANVQATGEPSTPSSPLVESPQAPSSLPVASLIDWKFFPGGDGAARVEVRTGNRVDTLAGVFAARDPLVTRDGLVHGIATSKDGGVVAGFDYDPATRKVTRFALPTEVNPSFPDIKLNETANFVAYVAHTRSGQSWAVVRTWPRLELVARSDSSPGYPSDAETDLVEWADSTHFKLSYLTRSGDEIRLTGDARMRQMKVDTVAAAELRGS